MHHSRVTAGRIREPARLRFRERNELKEAHYEIRDAVRNLQRRSFPNPGDDVKITAMFD
jgi:hypothetical protein